MYSEKIKIFKKQYGDVELEGYLTTGVHHYYNIEDSADGIKGMITFISPEDYPNCLWVGKEIEMYEGSKMIGYAIIMQIFNPTLEKII